MAEVTNVRPSDAARAISTLVLAFAADPHLRWVYPEADAYLTHFPDVLQTFAGAAFAGDTVWTTGDMAAVALWLPPGAEPDGNATITKFQASTDPAKIDDLMAVFAQMDEAHPSTPHWYLAWIGVDPAHHGHGMGSDVMSRCLQIVDGDHLPAYLDTPNPRAVPFYERHGFAVTGEWAAGDSPRSCQCFDLLTSSDTGLRRASRHIGVGHHLRVEAPHISAVPEHSVGG